MERRLYLSILWKLALSLAMVTLGKSNAWAGDLVEDPDYYDIRLELTDVRHLRNSQDFNTKGHASQSVQIYGARSRVQLKSDVQTEEIVKGLWVSLVSKDEVDAMLDACRAQAMPTLKDRKARVIVAAAKVPYGSVMRDPEDLYNAKVDEQKARNLEREAGQAYQIAKNQYASVTPAINAYKAEANATKDLKKKTKALDQAKNLQTQADAKLAAAKNKFEEFMARAAKMRDNAKRLKEKLAQRRAELAERLVDLNRQIENLTAKIADAESRRDNLSADKHNVTLQLKLGTKARFEEELDDLEPGIRNHIGLNVNKLSTSCE